MLELMRKIHGSSIDFDFEASSMYGLGKSMQELRRFSVIDALVCYKSLQSSRK